MLRSCLRTAWRQMIRHRSYTMINIIGLAVGMAAAALITAWVVDELSYDRFHTNLDRLYRVCLTSRTGGVETLGAATPGPLGPTVKAECPAVTNATRYADAAWLVKGENVTGYESHVALVDPDFLRMFSFRVVQGIAAGALDDPHSLILTESAAKRYFGSEDPIGRTLDIEQGTSFRVAAVMSDPPANSSLSFAILAPFEYLRESWEIDAWGAWMYYTYAMLAPGADPTATQSEIAGITGRHGGNTEATASLQSFSDIHLRSDIAYDLPGRGDIRYVWMFSVLAGLVLTMACVNFANLATARAAGRAREIGVRKAVGADRAQLVRQLLSESILTALAASIPAFAAAELLLPWFGRLTGRSVTPDQLLRPEILLLFVGMAVVTGVLSGVYPALVLSATSPARILRKASGTTSRGGKLRLVLVVTQFSLTIGLLAAMLVVSRQFEHMQQMDLGYDAQQVIYIPVRGDIRNNYGSFKSRLLENPAVLGVTAAFQLPGNIGSSPGSMDWEGKDAAHDARINAELVDFDYFRTFGMDIVEGRAFDPAVASDSTSAYILNETAVAATGLTDPIGKRFSFWDTPGQIVGVVRDFHSQPLQQRINPVVFKIDTYWMYFIYVRLALDRAGEALARVEGVWNELNPDYPFDYHFVDEQVARGFRAEQRMRTIVACFSGLAVFLAALGLGGLAAFAAASRRREVGIRKTLGATIPGLIGLLLREPLWAVLVAALVAVPATYLMMVRWLEGYAYRIELGAEPFVAAMVLAAVTGVAAVGVQTVRAALTNPSDVLKQE